MSEQENPSAVPDERSTEFTQPQPAVPGTGGSEPERPTVASWPSNPGVPYPADSAAPGAAAWHPADSAVQGTTASHPADPAAPGAAAWHPAGAGGPAAPVWPPPGPGQPTGMGQHVAPRPTGAVRWLVGGVAALVLVLCSGLIGGLVAHGLDVGKRGTVARSGATGTVPVLDRSSLASIAAVVSPSVVDIATGTGEGSGVILTADGAILTNNHVVEGATGKALRVTFSNGRTAQATIVGTDKAGDLAVVKAGGVSGLTPAKLGDSNALQIGDTVLALGSPLGLQGSVTAGIVSGLHRTIEAGDGQPNGASTRSSIGDVIQTDAAINPGNSGGALVNTSGEVIGVNTAIATSGQGEGNIGVGFAIPSNKAKATADQLLKGVKVSHPFLGVRIGDASSGGALLTDVTPGGPADKAGLQRGDVITKVGTQPVKDANGLVGAIQAGKPGDQVSMTFTRDGAERQATVTLGEAS